MKTHAALSVGLLSVAACSAGTASTDSTVTFLESRALNGEVVQVEITASDALPADLLEQILRDFVVQRTSIATVHDDTIFDPFVRLRTDKGGYQVIIPRKIEVGLEELRDSLDSPPQSELPTKKL